MARPTIRRSVRDAGGASRNLSGKTGWDHQIEPCSTRSRRRAPSGYHTLKQVLVPRDGPWPEDVRTHPTESASSAMPATSARARLGLSTEAPRDLPRAWTRGRADVDAAEPEPQQREGSAREEPHRHHRPGTPSSQVSLSAPTKVPPTTPPTSTISPLTLAMR